jgi:hypothetical protein
MLNNEIKNSIVEALLPTEPDKIILFGSYGYGIPDKESDIDLMIIKDIPEQEVRNQRLKINRILWEKFNSSGLFFDVLADMNGSRADVCVVFHESDGTGISIWQVGCRLLTLQYPDKIVIEIVDFSSVLLIA